MFEIKTITFTDGELHRALQAASTWTQKANVTVLDITVHVDKVWQVRIYYREMAIVTVSRIREFEDIAIP
jgi:hypothetical protein